MVAYCKLGLSDGRGRPVFVSDGWYWNRGVETALVSRALMMAINLRNLLGCCCMMLAEVAHCLPRCSGTVSIHGSGLFDESPKAQLR